MTLKLTEIKNQLTKDMTEEGYNTTQVEESIQKILADKGFTDIASLKADIIASIKESSTTNTPKIKEDIPETEETEQGTENVSTPRQSWNPFDG